MRFTIRFKPQDGESLSSYLFRCCHRNQVSIETIWRLTSKKGDYSFNYGMISSAEMNPIDYFDLNKLSSLTGQSIQTLKSMTYYSAASKLILEGKRGVKGNIIGDWNNYIAIKSRKVCVDCIRNGTRHQLIWNVYGAEYCEIHKTPLVDNCANCSARINYFDECFLSGKCSNCDEVLVSKYPREDKDENTLYRLSWQWLLNPSLVSEVEPSLIGYSLGLRLMYVVQKANYPGLIHQKWYKSLRKSVKSKQGTVTYTAVFKIVDITQKSLDEIYDIHLTEEMVEEIMLFPRKKPALLGDCKAPWCPSYTSNKSIRRVEKPYRKGYDVRSVCTNCYIEYGYSKKSGEWEDIDHTISLVQEVQRIKSDPLDIAELSRRLRISIKKVHEMLAYSDRYAGSSFYPEVLELTPQAAVGKFRSLLPIKGSKPELAEELFGWGILDYFGYFAMREVKHFLYFEGKHSRDTSTFRLRVQKEVNKYCGNGAKISLDEIAKDLGIARASLFNLGLNKVISSNNQQINQELLLEEKERLRQQINGFLQCREQVKQQWNKTELYKLLGARIAQFKKKHEDLFIYIDMRHTEMKGELRSAELELQKKRAEQIVEELRESMNTVLTMKLVCEKLGSNYNKINQNRELITYIRFLVNNVT